MRVSVRIHPGASRQKVVRVQGKDYLDIYVTKKAYRGQANKALVELVAQEFDVAPSRVRIVIGEKSRNKVVEIEQAG